MARKKQSRGNCSFCGKNMSKAGISKHLSTCAKRQELIDFVESNSRQQEGIFYHLRIQDAWQGDFWLHLEMDGKASMEILDSYLRYIWLECCGHMSEFSIGRWSGQTIEMSRKAGQVFNIGMVIDHIYDFGTSSETKIEVVNTRKGKSITKHPIALMARNERPEVLCVECGEPASYFCMECVYDYEEEGTLCEKHAKVHPHDNYGEPMGLFNSPRTGMCGYDGPAEPPY